MSSISITPRLFLQILLLMAIYYVTARIGLSFDAVKGFASLIWPPSGIAFAALYLFGHRLWPGIALGALAVNLSVGASIPMGLGMSLGNTLEALVGVYVFKRLVADQCCFNHVKDVSSLLIAGVLAAMISATLGVSSMYFASIVTMDQVASSWEAWMLGNTLSYLVLAPFIIISFKDKHSLIPRSRKLEAAILATLVVVGSVHLFRHSPGDFTHPINDGAWLFVLLIWTTLRFGQHLNILFIIMIAVISIWGTVSGLGPFHGPDLSTSLASLQLFVAAVTITGLLFGAVGREKERALSVRSDFVSIASHELRTPLSAVDLQLSLMRNVLERDISPKDQDKLVPALLRCQRQISSLVTLCDRLLDVTQIESGKLPIKRAPMNLSVLLEQMVDKFQHLLPELKIKSDLQKNVTGNWDAHRLDQVISNLFFNASKYGGSHGIELSLVKENAEVLIRVRDFGSGIPQAQQEKIFEKFERLVENEASGLGLGLYISRQIMEAHGGSIHVESHHDQGSTFVLKLPV